MITRKCSQCGQQMPLDKENSTGIILYKNKYYHNGCFVELCNEKSNNNRVRDKESWAQALVGINDLVEATTKDIRTAVAKDKLYHFILEHYRISFVNNSIFTKLDAVYNGTYRGLAYAIGPEELLSEWQYYWDFMLSNKQFKNMSPDQAVSYDLATLLAKNAEYRSEMTRKNVEEQVRAAQRDAEHEIDVTTLKMTQKNSERIKDSKRRADLFKEVICSGN